MFAIGSTPTPNKSATMKGRRGSDRIAQKSRARTATRPMTHEIRNRIAECSPGRYSPDGSGIGRAGPRIHPGPMGEITPPGRRFASRDRVAGGRNMTIKQRALVSLACLALAVPALHLGWAFHRDEADSTPSLRYRLVWGSVVKREMAPQAHRPYGPRLTIRLDDGPVLVHADLMNDRIDALPDRVSFYYSGDPSREVRLTQEKPLGADAMLFWATAAAFLCGAVLVWIPKAPSPGKKGVKPFIGL